MSIAELKTNLMNKLSSITDENLLNQIDNLLNRPNSNDLTSWETLSKF